MQFQPLFKTACPLIIGVMLLVQGCPRIDPEALVPPVDSGRESPDDSGSEAPDAPAPAFLPFDFQLSRGAFWEFNWVKSRRSWGSGGGSSSTETGTFRLVLGEPHTIQGLLAYPLRVEGDADDYAPRWRYLVFDHSRLLGSENGSSLVTVYDGQDGSWPGGGLFFDFGSRTLVTAIAGSIDNEFINGPAVVASVSTRQGQCETFPSVGTICPSETQESSRRREYYDPAVGPIGFYFFGSFSSRSGGASTEVHGGLVTASLDPVQYDSWEIEPNNSPAAAQFLEFGSGVTADTAVSDSGSPAPASADLQALADSLDAPVFLTAAFQDWYSFSVSQQRTVTVALEFSTTLEFDIDILLFDATATRILGTSLSDNAGAGNRTERIEVSLAPGDYLIAVWAFSGSGRTSYTMIVE